MNRRRYDRTIRLTQAELGRRDGAFPLTRGTQILVIGDDGEVRQSFGMAITDAWADPLDDEAELHWAVCIGVVALGEWARRQSAKHAARAFVATQPGYECACCAGTGIRPTSGDHVVVCDCGAEHPLPKSVDAILCGWTSQQGVASVMLGAIALGEWARRCAWDQLDECCAECWGLGIRGPCRRHRR